MTRKNYWVLFLLFVAIAGFVVSGCKPFEASAAMKPGSFSGNETISSSCPCDGAGSGNCANCSQANCPCDGAGSGNCANCSQANCPCDGAGSGNCANCSQANCPCNS